MMATTIKTAIMENEPALTGVLTLAFSADPMARWSQPDPQKYLENFPAIVRAFGGNAFADGTAYYATGFSGAALWLSPGVGPDEKALIDVIAGTAPDSIKADIFGVIEEMERFHPTGPHWYLPLIGVDPSRQGEGIGSALMKHALAACDRDGTVAYLESSNPRNVPLYERHSFEVIGEIQVGSSPTVRPMVRNPR